MGAHGTPRGYEASTKWSTRPQLSIFAKPNGAPGRKYRFLPGLVAASVRPGGNQTSFLKFGVAIGTHGEPMGIHRGPHWDPWNPWGHHGDPSGPQRDPMGTHRNPSGFHGDPMRTAFGATATPSGPPGRNYRFLRSQMGARCRSNGMPMRNYRFLRSQMRAKAASIDFYTLLWGGAHILKGIPLDSCYI